MPPPPGSEIVPLSALIGGRKIWATSSGASVALRRLAAQDMGIPTLTEGQSNDR